MFITRRSALAAGAATLIAGPGPAGTEPRHAEGVAAVERLSAEANSALMRGDIGAYVSLMRYSDDFTFMSPFGGHPKRRSDFTDERMAAMGRYFRNGDFAQELVESYAAGNLVVLIVIERQTVEVGGLPAQEWPLRVTLVYRHAESGWELVHRHADPLLHDLGLDTAAELARGAH